MMLDLKREVTAYDCFRRNVMQSGQFKQTLDVFFIIYKVHAFPKSKKKASLLTFKE